MNQKAIFDAIGEILKEQKELTTLQVKELGDQVNTVLADLQAKVDAKAERGEKGDAGDTPDIEVVADAVFEKYGEILKGEQGQEGKDAEIDINDVVKTLVNDDEFKTLIEVPEPDHELIAKQLFEKYGDELKGEAGKDAEDVEIDIDDVVKALVSDHEFKLLVQAPKPDEELIAKYLFEEYGDILKGRDAVVDYDEVVKRIKSDESFVESLKGQDADTPDIVLVAKHIIDNHADLLKGDQGEKGDPVDVELVTKRIFEDEEFIEKVRGPQGDKGEPGQDGAGIHCKNWEQRIYREGEKVQAHLGQIYKAIKDTNEVPGDSADWERVGSFGFRWCGVKKDDYEYRDGDLYIDKGTTFLFIEGKGRMLAQKGKTGAKGEKGDDGLDAVDIIDIIVDTGGVAFVKADGTVLESDFKGLTEYVEKTVESFVEAKALTFVDMMQQMREDLNGPVIAYRGIYRHDRGYSKGDLVNFQKGLYLALQKPKKGSLDPKAFVKIAGGGGGGGGGGQILPPAVTTSNYFYGFNATNKATGWLDGRLMMGSVATIGDLSNRATLPLSSLDTGKLVYVKSQNKLYELIHDPASLSNDLTDWREIGSGGVKYVNRLSDLPNANSLPAPQDGQIYVAKVDFEGKPYFRLVTWDQSIAGAPAKTTIQPLNHQVGDEIDDGAAYTTLITTGPVNQGRWYVVNTAAGITPLPGEPYAGVHLPLGTKLIDLGDPNRGRNGWTVASPDPNFRVGQAAALPNPQVVDDLAKGRINGGWRFINRESYVNNLASDSDHPLDNRKGDFQTVIENGKKIIKVYDGRAWQTLFDEQQIKGWIASLALFRGTISEDPTHHVGTITWGDLPDLTTLSAAQDKSVVGRYWIWAGQDPFNVLAPTPGGTTGPQAPRANGMQPVAQRFADAITDDATLLQHTNPAPAIQWTTFPINTAFTPAAGNPFAGTALATGHSLIWTGIPTLNVNDRTNNVVYQNGWGYAPAAAIDGSQHLHIDPQVLTVMNNAINALPPPVTGTPEIGPDLGGSTLHVGDWLVIADQGTGNPGDPNEVDLHWVRVGGDLLTKSRGANLFGLKNWVAGSWEQDSLVVHGGDIYRAQTPIVPSDLAPDAGTLPANTTMPGAGVHPTNDVAGQVINDQTDLERLCITQPPPAQWQAYPIGTDFNVAGAPNGFFDGTAMTTGERMTWTGFPNLTAVDAVNNIQVVDGWMHDPGTVTMPGGAQAVMISPLMLQQIQASLPTVNWSKINIGGAIKFIGDETGLPAIGSIGESYLILTSATYGHGDPAIVTWDAGAGDWVIVSGGGGGTPMSMLSANQIVGVGCPIGTIIMWASATIPSGWLPLTGQAVDATLYPELAALFPGGNLPNMAGQFVRVGAIEAGFTRHPHTTARPRTAFTTDNQGNHRHTRGFSYDDNAWDRGSRGGGYVGYYHDTGDAGAHTHTITGGGDAETAPDYVYLGMLIKATDSTTQMRTH